MSYKTQPRDNKGRFLPKQRLKVGDTIKFLSRFDAVKKGSKITIERVVDENYQNSNSYWIYYKRPDGTSGGFRVCKTHGYAEGKDFEIVPVKTTTKRKTNNKLTQVNVFVIDDSGSIGSNKMTDSIKQGMDKIIDDVTSENKDQMFWGLSMFGKYSNKHYAFSNSPLRLVNYDPYQSATALYDGIGYAIENTIQYITKNKITHPSIVFNIFTDGEENNSKMYNKEKINSLISQKRDEGWMINFIGGGDDKEVKKVAQDLGIFAANTVSYSTNSAGTSQVLSQVSQSMKRYSKSVKQGKTSNEGFFA